MPQTLPLFMSIHSFMTNCLLSLHVKCDIHVKRLYHPCVHVNIHILHPPGVFHLVLHCVCIVYQHFSLLQKLRGFHQLRAIPDPLKNCGMCCSYTTHRCSYPHLACWALWCSCRDCAPASVNKLLSASSKSILLFSN